MLRKKVPSHLAFFATNQLTHESHRTGSLGDARQQTSERNPRYHFFGRHDTKLQILHSSAGEQTSMHEGAIVTTCKLRPEESGRRCRPSELFHVDNHVVHKWRQFYFFLSNPYAFYFSFLIPQVRPPPPNIDKV